jgi:hypothetical protein
VRAIELLEAYFIAALLQAEEQASAAVYGQDLVLCAVRNKDTANGCWSLFSERELTQVGKLFG